ncbi:PTS sugar transporter subunit IIB [Enterococcus sp. BWM-S5]|uniref:PTS sugar transporter subunit IIB n=1 Tax=Enterococcus larvae TaxID=2794352 RepID=A0ABS4CK13_9ENTE|nr:PTS sugar transporter subunit IIB [Enterococcus larvae]MBP1046950.1 PTS sugar transporter subunit IIB [Enterococcus larvae]
MINITVACAAGMSTSLLVSKMEKYAAAQNIDVAIIAVPEKQFEKHLSETDILLLGPQISFLEEKYKEKYQESSFVVSTISIIDYGRMDGAKVVEMALSLLKGGQKNE